MWSKRREQYTRLCHKCGKNISAGEERFVRNTGNIISYFYHLDCGEAEWKKYQLSIKDKTDKCFSELRQLWDDLEPKVENEDLEVKDVKRINALKKEIDKLIKTKGIEDFDLTYPTVEVDFDNLKKTLTELDNFIKESASPRTIDIANKKKYSKVRNCSHDNGIEPCTDDSTFFCCSYCWDTNSPEFLKMLKRWYISNIGKELKEHNVSEIEFAKSSTNYSKLLGNDFTNQEELKAVFQQAEKDLQELLKKKGIPTNINCKRERERERERERAKLKSEITNLENKPNKTLEEGKELEDKKKQLEDLDKKLKNNPSTNSNSSNYTHWLIGGVCLLVFLVLVVFIIANHKKRKH